jgi:hypothetical protein
MDLPSTERSGNAKGEEWGALGRVFSLFLRSIVFHLTKHVFFPPPHSKPEDPNGDYMLGQVTEHCNNNLGVTGMWFGNKTQW